MLDFWPSPTTSKPLSYTLPNQYLYYEYGQHYTAPTG